MVELGLSCLVPGPEAARTKCVRLEKGLSLLQLQYPLYEEGEDHGGFGESLPLNAGQ